MIGNNELHLNTKTMIEAMQQWIDAKMPHESTTDAMPNMRANAGTEPLPSEAGVADKTTL